MHISTNTGLFDKMGDTKTIIKHLKDAGFDCYDYTMSVRWTSNLDNNFVFSENYVERAKELRAYADRIGIKCNQSHAPYPSWKRGEAEYNEKRFGEIVKALEITSILGAKICVVHPHNPASAQENAEFYKKLLPYAKKFNVKIALENMWDWDNGVIGCACSSHEDFLAHLELLDREWFVACVDIGHAEMEGLNTSAVKMIKTLGDRVQALHMHDNDFKNDNHVIPYTMKIDFNAVCEALKEVGYQGDITLEVVDITNNLPRELFLEQTKYMALVANNLREKFAG